MNKQNTSGTTLSDARRLAAWARRYAKSRTISFLVQWVFIVLMVTAIGFSAQFAHRAQRENEQTLLYASVGLMILAFCTLAWFSISKRGGEIIFNITQWLYGEEGYVSDNSDEVVETPWWVTLLTGGLILYHLAGALLATFGHLSLSNLQPFSALYMSPYIAIMIFHQRLGFWAWCWPILYGVHALLLYFEFPIRFTGQLELLNLAVPVFGYGLISILVGHIYNRFALYNLRRIARSQMPDMPVLNGDDVE